LLLRKSWLTPAAALLRSSAAAKAKAQIINKLEIEYLISKIYGRILTIISNNQLLNNKTNLSG
jgi:hypothetical protein